MKRKSKRFVLLLCVLALAGAVALGLLLPLVYIPTNLLTALGR